MVGRQADASTQSTLISRRRKRRGKPVAISVAAISSSGPGVVRRSAKSICASSSLREGSKPRGLKSEGENRLATCANAFDLEMPANQGLLRNRSGTPALATASHTALSFTRAAARPPSARPAASATALTAPALVPLSQPGSIVSSSSSRSSTPQVKAPCAPPPSSARLRSRLRRMKTKEGTPHSPPPRPRQQAQIPTASWQHVGHEHNGDAFDASVLRSDAVDGGKVLALQHFRRRAGGNVPARLQQHDPVTEARGERQIVQRDNDGAASRSERGEM